MDHNGDFIILDYAITILDLYNSEIPQEQINQIISSLEDYLTQKNNFEETKEIFLLLLKNSDVLDKIKEFITVSEEPLPPYQPDEDSLNQQNRKKMRNWTNYEDIRLLGGIYRFGIENWTQIAKFVGNSRTRSQCAQRWSRGLNPRICKEHWDTSEDLLLLKLVNQFGEKSWTKVAYYMGNRSDVQCRYHYYQIQKDMPHSLKVLIDNRCQYMYLPRPISHQQFYLGKSPSSDQIQNPIPIQKNITQNPVQIPQTKSTMCLDEFLTMFK